MLSNFHQTFAREMHGRSVISTSKQVTDWSFASVPVVAVGSSAVWRFETKCRGTISSAGSEETRSQQTGRTPGHMQLLTKQYRQGEETTLPISRVIKRAYFPLTRWQHSFPRQSLQCCTVWADWLAHNDSEDIPLLFCNDDSTLQPSFYCSNDRPSSATSHETCLQQSSSQVSDLETISLWGTRTVTLFSCTLRTKKKKRSPSSH